MSGDGRSKPGVLLAKLAASTVLTVLLLAAVEFAAGFFVLPLEAVSGKSVSKGDTVSATLAWLWANPAPLREDPNFLWHNQRHATRTQFVNPQALGSTAEWTIKTNARGFRGPEIRSDRSKKSTYRVLCIGDSVTFGFNGDQEDTYPARLGEFLRAKQPGKDIEVINAGVPGWTWLQGLRFLEMEGLALEPDLVIMAHGVNDQLMQALISDSDRLKHAADPRVLRIAKMRLLVADTNIYRFIEQQFDTPPLPNKPSPGCQKQIADTGSCRRVSTDEIEMAVSSAAELTKSNGIDLLVLNLDFLKTAAAEAAQKAAESADIPFVDLVRRRSFLRAAADLLRSDELGLLPSEDHASQPLVPPVERRRRVIFRVQTPDATASYSVSGRTGHYIGNFKFHAALNDEGLDGDEKAADGVFGATLTLPPDIGAIHFKFYRGEEPEFKPLPPLNSQFGDRSLTVRHTLTTHVYRFAESFMMAERTHPNGEGYAMIAESVAFEITKLPSFHR
jgi:lysophospholipase L1-like esterase